MSGPENLLRISNLHWDDAAFLPAPVPDDLGRLRDQLEGWEGQFTFVLDSPHGVVLVRDKHGVNKLFYAIREAGEVIAANFVADLVARGVPFEAIYSVPSGHFTVVDTASRRLEHVRYYDLPEPSPEALAGAAREVRASLDRWFGRMGESLADREIRLCLSGGLDSSVIAALAARHLPRVKAVTYSFVDASDTLSEDARYAARVAEHLGIPLELVKATEEDIRRVVDEAIVYGQDWRDFNVHCAVVNALLSGAMVADLGDRRDSGVVFTGDMMNEILADYTPISYGGREYYRLPHLEPERLRRVLVRGLDAGDREIGVFAHHGLSAIQPYGLTLDAYLRLPLALLGDGGKQRLVREVASDLLPEFVLDRKKVRAQIGTSEQPTGILPVFADAGWDTDWLASRWCEAMKIDDPGILARFIRGGVYRAPPSYPSGQQVKDGYLAG